MTPQNEKWCECLWFSLLSQYSSLSSPLPVESMSTCSSLSSSTSDSRSSKRRTRSRTSKHPSDYSVTNTSPQDSILSPDLPTHFQQGKRQRPTRDELKPYQNPTHTYFIPGITGRARCLQDDHDVIHDLKRYNQNKSMKSIGSTRSMESSGSCKSVASLHQRLRDSLERQSQREHNFSAPCSPTQCGTTELEQRSSKSLDDIMTNTANEGPQLHNERPRNAPFPLGPLSAESRSTRSLLLQNQLASIRSILSDTGR